MNEREKINVVMGNGEERSADVLLHVTLETTGKNYVLYTFHEVDEKNLETVYASTVVISEGQEILTDIETEEEWTEIKKIMKETIKKNQQNNG